MPNGPLMGGTATLSLLADAISSAQNFVWVFATVYTLVLFAYIITSWLSAELTPTYGWRILWLLGLPTGLLLIVLNHWIPESPRFLFQNGRDAGVV